MGNISISNEPEGIVAVIKAVDRGELLLDMEQAFRDVVDAVIEQQKSGKVTLDIAFQYDTSTEAMRVSGTVKKTMPQKKSKQSMFFISPDGTLSRMDHRQRDMFIAPKEGVISND